MAVYKVFIEWYKNLKNQNHYLNHLVQGTKMDDECELLDPYCGQTYRLFLQT